jgi:HK97 gp10 family phage protein
MARVEMVAGWTAQLRPAIRDLLENRLGPAIADDARAACPVDTGKLKGSIHVVMREDGMAVQIHADAKAEDRNGGDLDYTYAGYVEEGTRHMAPQPYLRPSLWRRRS